MRIIFKSLVSPNVGVSGGGERRCEAERLGRSLAMSEPKSRVGEDRQGKLSGTGQCDKAPIGPRDTHSASRLTSTRRRHGFLGIFVSVLLLLSTVDLTPVSHPLVILGKSSTILAIFKHGGIVLEIS